VVLESFSRRQSRESRIGAERLRRLGFPNVPINLSTDDDSTSRTGDRLIRWQSPLAARDIGDRHAAAGHEPRRIAAQSKGPSERNPRGYGDSGGSPPECIGPSAASAHPTATVAARHLPGLNEDPASARPRRGSARMARAVLSGPCSTGARHKMDVSRRSSRGPAHRRARNLALIARYAAVGSLARATGREFDGQIQHNSPAAPAKSTAVCRCDGPRLLCSHRV